MNDDAHNLGIGKIIGNSLSLELLLRVFIAEARGEHATFPKPRETSIPETHLTNYDSLGRLIEKFNAQLTQQEQKYKIDSDADHTRDAIAHGRIAALAPTPPLTLYRFGKPNNGQVPVLFIEEITQEWL